MKAHSIFLREKAAGKSLNFYNLLDEKSKFEIKLKRTLANLVEEEDFERNVLSFGGENRRIF